MGGGEDVWINEGMEGEVGKEVFMVREEILIVVNRREGFVGG